MRRWLRFVSLSRVAASFLVAATILFVASADAQVNDVPRIGRRPAGSILTVTPTHLSFSEIKLSSSTVTETKAFTIKDTGDSPLSLTVAPPVGSQFFRIMSGRVRRCFSRTNR